MYHKYLLSLFNLGTRPQQWSSRDNRNQFSSYYTINIYLKNKYAYTNLQIIILRHHSVSKDPIDLRSDSGAGQVKFVWKSDSCPYSRSPLFPKLMLFIKEEQVATQLGISVIARVSRRNYSTLGTPAPGFEIGVFASSRPVAQPRIESLTISFIAEALRGEKYCHLPDLRGSALSEMQIRSEFGPGPSSPFSSVTTITPPAISKTCEDDPESRFGISIFDLV